MEGSFYLRPPYTLALYAYWMTWNWFYIFALCFFFTIFTFVSVPDGMLLTPTAFSPDVTPIRDLTSELSRNSELSCLNDRISILVPIGLVVKHGLTPGMVTWRTSSCRSRMTDEGLVLETSYNSCGSRVTRNSDDSLRVSNEVRYLWEL